MNFKSLSNEGIAIGNLGESSHFMSATVSTTSTDVLLENMPSIIHRFENNALSSCFASSFFDPNFSTLSDKDSKTLVKCPCCRQTTSKLMCFVCALQKIRIGKVHEKYRELFMRKAQLSCQIEQELKPEINHQLDMNSKLSSIKLLKKRIANKIEHLDRMKHRIKNIDTNNVTTKKNNILLEEKLVAFDERIIQIENKIKLKHEMLSSIQKKVTKEIVKIIAELLEIFPIKRLEKLKPIATATKQPDAWSIRHHLGKQLPIVYTIKNLPLDDYSNYEQLLNLFSENSSTSVAKSLLQKFSIRQNLGALLFLSNIVECFGQLLDCRLPYSRINKCWLDLVGSIGRNSCTKNFFKNNVFKLNLCIIFLCVSCGVPLTILEFKRPVNNLISLINMIKDCSNPSSNKFLKLRPALNSFNPKLYLETLESFQEFKCIGQSDIFNLDDVDEDWVNVNFSYN